MKRMHICCYCWWLHTILECTQVHSIRSNDRSMCHAVEICCFFVSAFVNAISTQRYLITSELQNKLQHFISKRIEFHCAKKAPSKIPLTPRWRQWQQRWDLLTHNGIHSFINGSHSAVQVARSVYGWQSYTRNCVEVIKRRRLNVSLSLGNVFTSLSRFRTHHRATLSARVSNWL